MSRDFDCWAEQADDYRAGQLQAERDLALDLEAFDTDCRPLLNVPCESHPSWKPADVLWDECPHCLAEFVESRRVQRERFDYRPISRKPAV